MRRLAGMVADAVREERFPLVLGGDHSIGLGTLAGLAAAAGRPGGVIWVDAHGDLNTPATSPTGNVHGMPWPRRSGSPGRRSPTPVSCSRRSSWIAWCCSASARSTRTSRRSCAHAGIHVITMSQIDRIGHRAGRRRGARARLRAGFVHLSLDLDALDPEVAPGVGTPVPGGLTYREAHLACELAAESGAIGSLELVEVNPILDRENSTAIAAVELAASALGLAIL